MKHSRDETLAVLCLDLDHFKSVNDTLGFPIGDVLLKAVSDRLRNCVRDLRYHRPARGDEFAVLQVPVIPSRTSHGARDQAHRDDQRGVHS